MLLFVTFLLLVTSVNYFFIVEGSLFVIFCYFFLLIITFINYFLLLRGAKEIILLYLFIVQGEGVRLDFFFKFLFLLRGEGVDFFYKFIMDGGWLEIAILKIKGIHGP